jgi:hypothetical protein
MGVDVGLLLPDGLVDGPMLGLIVGSLLPNRFVDGEKLRLSDGTGRRFTATGWTDQCSGKCCTTETDRKTKQDVNIILYPVVWRLVDDCNQDLDLSIPENAARREHERLSQVQRLEQNEQQENTTCTPKLSPKGCIQWHGLQYF